MGTSRGRPQPEAMSGNYRMPVASRVLPSPVSPIRHEPRSCIDNVLCMVLARKAFELNRVRL